MDSGVPVAFPLAQSKAPVVTPHHSEARLIFNGRRTESFLHLIQVLPDGKVELRFCDLVWVQDMKPAVTRKVHYYRLVPPYGEEEKASFQSVYLTVLALTSDPTTHKAIHMLVERKDGMYPYDLVNGGNFRLRQDDVSIPPTLTITTIRSQQPPPPVDL